MKVYWLFLCISYLRVQLFFVAVVAVVRFAVVAGCEFELGICLVLLNVLYGARWLLEGQTG